MKEFEIYFGDLTDGAQKRLMNAVGIEDPREMNWDMDIFPVAWYPLSNVNDDDFLFDLKDVAERIV